MALITKTEAKNILQISDSTYDDVLGVLIPIVTYQIVYSICQNKFLNPRVYLTASTLSFSNSTKKITDSEEKFLESYFTSGSQDFCVTGSYYNDGIYEASGISASEITLEQATMTRDFTDETAGAFITVQRVEFPYDLKETTAKWLNYLINKQNLKGVSSERVLSYSVTYTAGMPDDVKKEFRYHRKAKW